MDSYNNKPSLGSKVSWVFTIIALRKRGGLDLPPEFVPLPMLVLEPWPEGEAERSPEAMVLSFQEPEAGSPVNCAA